MPAQMKPWAFVLAVRDLEKSTRYYRDVLCFRVRWEEADDWRLAERDGMRLMIGHCPDDAPAAETGSHNWFGYVEVDDIDALYREIAARGAASTAPKDQPYGMREIVVTTIDGHRIVFAQELKKAA